MLTESQIITAEAKDLTPADRLKQIHLLERALLALPESVGPEDEIWQLKHFFADGMYARQITIPEGVTLTGKCHRHKHFFMLSRGEISIMSPEAPVMRIQAPFLFISPSGTKRAIHAHAEAIVTTFHATDETDLDKLEDELIISPEGEKPCLGSL